MIADGHPGGIVALSFQDALRAASFALALRNAVAAERRTSGGADGVLVWMDHPLDSVGAEICCVYVNEAGLAAARRAALSLPEPAAVHDPGFPGNRLPVVEALHAGLARTRSN